MPQKSTSRSSTMTAAEFRALRLSTGCTVRQWAALLHSTTQSVRNMECAPPIGRQVALAAILLAHPAVRALLPDIFSQAEKIMGKSEKKTECSLT